jgi:DNA-binding NarL/FixJ family response regulator
VSRISVILSELPPVLEQIVRGALREASDLEVVGRVDDSSELLRHHLLSETDVVVIALVASALPQAYADALRRHPLLRIIAVARDGRTVTRYELRPSALPLGELSRESLVDAVRDAARDGAANSSR